MGTELLFKALADATRQRLLRVLSLQELSVSELVEVLDQPQSTLSRHLKVLRQAGLLVDRRSRTTVLYAAVPPDRQLPGHGPVARLGGNGLRRSSTGINGLRGRLLEWVGNEELDPTVQARLERVISRRSGPRRDFFESVGARWDQLRIEAFGEVFHFEALAALLPAEWTVADIGTGTGYLLPVLSSRFHRVIAVEPAGTMLEVARNRCAQISANNVVFREGSLSRLPLDNGEVDLAIASLVLHHVDWVEPALAELRRCIRVGGRLLIVEQEEHHHPEFHERMGDHWWGFSPEALAERVGQAGFAGMKVRPLCTARPARPHVNDVPKLFVLTAVADKQRSD